MRWPALVPLMLCATGCGGTTFDPGEGTALAHLTSRGTVISVSVDQGDVYVILLDAAGSLRITVDRVRGSEVVELPLAPTDWSDYTQGPQVGLDPAKTALVSGGKAYFLGAYGVTVVPLDGSPSRTMYEPDPLFPAGHAFNSLGAFAVDGDRVYVCDDETLGTRSSALGRFEADGTWQPLVAASSTRPESCFGGAIAADADAVYWSTSGAIRACSKHDGTVATVVSLGGLASAPPLLAIGGGSLVWFDWLDLAFHAVDKDSMTPALPAALGATTLVRFGPTDETPFSMLAISGRVYWLTFYDLHELPTGGGAAALLAHRPQSGGRCVGLATDGKNLYFTDGDSAGDGGGGDVTLRSVPL